MPQMLTEHFSLEEMCATDFRDIDNTPSAEIIENLRRTAHVLEEVRNILGYPIRVNSGYRCKILNFRIGGSVKSAHMKGLAADIISPKFGSPLSICQTIYESNIAYDQLIHEYGRWVHIGLADKDVIPRKEILSIHSLKDGYKPGLF